MVDELGQQDDGDISGNPMVGDQNANSLPSGGSPVGGGLSGRAGISGGQGIFHGLISTMMQGLVARAAQGGKAALAQRNETPYARSMAAGINAPEVAQQKAQKQAEATDEAALRKQRIAMGQLYEMQTKHALQKADEETQVNAYNVQRDYYDELDKQAMVNWEGGTFDKIDDSALGALSRAKAKYPGQDVRIVAKGGTTRDTPMYQIAVVKKGNLIKDIHSVLNGPKDAVVPVPNMPLGASQGTEASDSTVDNSHAARNGVIQNIQASTAKQIPEGAPIHTFEELQSRLQEAGFPTVTNLHSIYDYAKGGDAKFNAKSSRDRSGIEYNQEDSEELIRNSGWFPNFDPKQASEDRKTVEELDGYLKGEGMKDYVSTLNAQERSSEVIKSNPTNPHVYQAAQAVYNESLKRLPLFPTPKEAEAAKVDPRFESWREKVIAPVQAILLKDGDKMADLTNAMASLNAGGGIFDAVAKIQFLRGTVGGGGVRITGAELNSLASARGWKGDFDVFFSHLDDKTVKSLTPIQRDQLKSILNDSYALLSKKSQAYADAETQMLTANNATGVRAAQLNLVKALRPENTITATRTTAAPPTPVLDKAGKPRPALGADNKPLADGVTGNSGKYISKGGIWTLNQQR